MSMLMERIEETSNAIARDYGLDKQGYKFDATENAIASILFEGPHGSPIFGCLYVGEFKESEDLRVFLLRKFSEWAGSFEIGERMEHFWELDLEEAGIQESTYMRELVSDKKFFDDLRAKIAKEIEEASS